LALGLLVAAFGPSQPAGAASDSKGADFWLAFPENLGTPTLTLFVTGDVASAGTVDVPGIGFTTGFTVTPGTVTSIPIPLGAQLSGSDTVENKGIHVTASDEITVYGLNQRQFTTDAYLGLPTDILGTEYIVLGYKNTDIVNATQFAVVATQDATTVSITPSVTTGAHPAGITYTVAMNQGQTYQLRNTGAAPADLSGSIVTADKPIGVYGGHQCANIPPGVVACDHLVEQLFPTATWGQAFVTMPLATRIGGDTFRFLAGTDNTTVSINGVAVATLNRGQLHEQLVAGAAHITADQPILVAQYSNGTAFDGVTSDPFEMLVPPFEQFLAGYTVTTPASGFSGNYINVVTPTATVGAVTLDGVPIPSGSFTAIGTSGFSGAQLSVALGSHTLAGPQPFGVSVYGFDFADSYGYPGGLSLAPIAMVTSLALAPETAVNTVGTEHCVTATVLDQADLPLEGVRVDFVASGANAALGSVNTDAAGHAVFCYTGTNTGDDTITASVGQLSDTAAKRWVAAPTGGTIIITKATDPGGSPEAFTFNVETGGVPVPGSPFIATDATDASTGLLPPGTYSVAEVVPAGWDLTAAVCDDGSPPGAISLGAGETVTCTFLNQADAGDLTVRVVGGDPTFTLTPAVVPPFTLDPGESISFTDLPTGAYTLTMTDLEAGLVLDAIDCDPEEISFSLAGRSVTFTIVDDASITCTFTVSGADDDDDYDTYDDDPGDADFDFDTPFDDDDPAAAVQVAGNNNSNQTSNQQPTEQPQGSLAILPETAAQPGQDTAPAALDTLPRTGSGAGGATVAGGLFLILGGLATVVGRRRQASQA
jgi:LPXTG-motif cell wall-anchored protein